MREIGAAIHCRMDLGHARYSGGTGFCAGRRVCVPHQHAGPRAERHLPAPSLGGVQPHLPWARRGGVFKVFFGFARTVHRRASGRVREPVYGVPVQPPSL